MPLIIATYWLHRTHNEFIRYLRLGFFHREIPSTNLHTFFCIVLLDFFILTHGPQNPTNPNLVRVSPISQINRKYLARLVAKKLLELKKLNEHMSRYLLIKSYIQIKELSFLKSNLRLICEIELGLTLTYSESGWLEKVCGCLSGLESAEVNEYDANKTYQN